MRTRGENPHSPPADNPISRMSPSLKRSVPLLIVLGLAGLVFLSWPHPGRPNRLRCAIPTTTRPPPNPLRPLLPPSRYWANRRIGRRSTPFKTPSPARISSAFSPPFSPPATPGGNSSKSTTPKPASGPAMPEPPAFSTSASPRPATRPPHHASGKPRPNSRPPCRKTARRPAHRHRSRPHRRRLGEDRGTLASSSATAPRSARAT